VTPARVELLAKDRSEVYLRRAENLLRVMEVADEAGNPDGVVTNAVQAGIALGDAYTVALVQRRSRGQDHSEVLLLIRECRTPNTREVARLVQGILNRRSEVLYESRDVSLKRARELAGMVRKLHSAVLSSISPKPSKSAK
jgi:hypothetical protein